MITLFLAEEEPTIVDQLDIAMEANQGKSQLDGERPSLTERHVEILWEIVTNSDASQAVHAERLSISVNTLKKHLSTMYRILDVKNIQSCILKCLQLGYVPISVIECKLLEANERRDDGK